MHKKILFLVFALLIYIFSFSNSKIAEANLDCVDNDNDGICASFISPSGGETLTAGTKYNIQWNQKGVDMVTIGYKTCDSCLDWVIYNKNVDLNQNNQSHEWTIPENLGGRSDVSLEIIAYKTGSAQDVAASNKFNIASGAGNVGTITNTNNVITTNKIITNTSDLPKSDVYKAIVKIKSFTLNIDNELTLFSSGSGAIINSSGIVLTNHHVIALEDNFDDTERESSYIICLTEEISKEPDCSYTGQLIASNKEMDIALLKINNVAGYSNKSSFPYLDLNTTDTAAVSNEITVLGYPSIGGDTITITKGIISGKESKYNKSWIKTDAVVSYGNSGGAAIDASGKMVGITSSSHSDLLGSLGYIINIVSINDWINSNKIKNTQTNSLADRTIDLVKRVINYKNSSNNRFDNDSPRFSITKPNDWNFTYEYENALVIGKNSDDDGGAVGIGLVQFPYVVDISAVEGKIKRDLSIVGMNSMASILKNEDVVINGKKAKKFMLSAAGNQTNGYYIPVKNYLLEIAYNYGKNDKDKSIVDNIINSLVINETEYFTEITTYINKNPKFSIRGGNGWVFLPQNSKERPLFIIYKPERLAFADIDIIKTDDNTRNLNNEEFLRFYEQQTKEKNSILSRLDIKVEILKSDAHYKLNNEFPDVIMIDYVKKSVSTGKTLSQNREYYIKTGDKYILPSLNYHGDDINSYNQILSRFNEMLLSMSLKAEDILTPTSSVSPTASSQLQIVLISQLKSGDVVKSSSNSSVYVIQDGKKVKVNSPEEFNQKGYKWNQIKEIPADELSQIPTMASGSAPVANVVTSSLSSYPNGTLIKAVDGNDVYVIINGKKKKIPDPATFNAQGYKWDRIKKIAGDELSRISDDVAVVVVAAPATTQTPQTSVKGIGPGALIKSADNPTIYYITSKAMKKPIPTIAVFRSYPENKFENVKVVPQSQIDNYPTVNILKVNGDAKVYLIENGKKRWVKTMEALTNRGFSHEKVTNVNQVELDTYPDGEVID